MENVETTNINVKWLENIYEQLRTIQNLERMAREGCKSIGEYLQIPLEMQKIIIPDARYKNMKFLAMELDMLIKNLIPIIEKKYDEYEKKLKPILENYEKRGLFIHTIKKNNNQFLQATDFLTKTINLLIKIKSDIIKDIAPILYIKSDENKKW